MQKIKLAFAASILAAAYFLAPAPAASATTCPTGCTLCFPTSPLGLNGPCCKAGDPRHLRCA
jgi:hypothetical protein